MAGSNGTSPPRSRTEPVRTERPSTYVQGAPIGDPARTGLSSKDSASKTNSRTEQTASTVAPQPRPLDLGGTARVLTAKVLDDALTKHWRAREAWASNRCIADHYCENTESVVRRWRNGEKSIPLAALHVLPAPLAEHLARTILRARGVDLRQASASLSEAVDAVVDAVVEDDDREEVVRGLLDAQNKIAARLAALATGAK